MNEIYFDNAATTKPSKEVLDKLLSSSEYLYANPSSMHDFGLSAELAIKESSKTLASIINCSYEEIIYTSGGTESNNTAILGAANAAYKKNIVTTAVEHPSVAECYKSLAGRGYNVTYLPVGNDGSLDLNFLENSINENTSLISILHVNNETGAIQDIEKIGKIIKAKNTAALYHVDAVQSFCKHKIDVRKSNIDFLSMSSHKIHGLKGCGALYIKNKTRINPIIFGGGQQRNIRPGTENSLGIMAFSTAADLAYRNIKQNYEKVKLLKEYITDNITDIGNVCFNSSENSSPYILNISFLGIKSEILLHALSEYNIFISAGSACSAKLRNHSVLTAYGKAKEIVESSVRLSFSHFNNIKEGEYFIETLKKIMPKIINKYK